MKKKLLALMSAAILALGAVPSVSFAEGYRTRHVLDGWIDGTNWAYDVNTSKYNSFETEHFQIFWGDNGPSSGNVTEDFLKNCERVFENCWDKFVVEMGMTPPTTSNLPGGDHETQYKINAIIMNTGIDGYGEGWAFGGIDGEGYPYFMCDFAAMTDWVVPHEMGHVMHFAQGRNAWENNSYLGPWYEAIGNWFREQYLYDEDCYPEGANYRTDLSALYLRAGSLMAVNGRGYYEAWPFLQYLTDNPDGLPDFGDTFIAKLLNYRPESYETSFYEVLAANSTTSVPDTVGYFASHMATMDFKQKTSYNLKIAEMYRNGWLFWQQRFTIPEHLGGGVYRVPAERTPQTYGYNIIPLSASGEVSVTLNGQSALDGADWRARLIVEGTDGVTRYSELFKSGETASVTVSEGEELYLSVAATPAVDKAQKFGIGGWTPEFSEANLPYESKNQYPYTFTLEGASPMKRPRGTTAMGRLHENGGGFVALTANVAETAYVGPDAQVLGRATVSDNAVIDGNAIVSEYATVSGNAYVGGNAVVMGAATVSGNARVTESALVYGNYKVSGNALIKGQAILLGAGTATGQAIAYGDLFEDEGKTITAGAFSGYHGVNANYGYAVQAGDNSFSRPYIDRLQARYEFNGGFRDSLGYSDMYAYDGSAPELSDGCAVFNGEQYLVIGPAVLSRDNAEIRLRVKYEAGSIFDLGGLVLTSRDGRPCLELGSDGEIVLDAAYSGGWDDIKITVADGAVTLSCGGESKSLEGVSLPYSSAVGYIGQSGEGDGFSGSIDYLRIYLPDDGSEGLGELPDGVSPVFEAAGAESPLSALTTDNDSAWCGWQTETAAVTAGETLTVPAGGSVELTSPTYGKDVFVLEFTPMGDSIYPDHALIDGSGKYICAHRFASDANRIYPGRGEQNFCGSENVTDTAAQKRLHSFIAEAVYYGSALSERGAVSYSEGETVRITVQNTEWSDELSKALKGAVNKSAANLSSMESGDPVYTVTYSLVDNGLARPVSLSCYKGSVSGFGGIKSFGTWNDKSVGCGDLRIFADEVPTQLTALSGGVIVTNAEGTLVFAAYESGALEKASTVEAAGERLTRFFPLPEGFPDEADVFLLSSLAELSPLTKPANIREIETVWTSSGQNASAFHELSERSGKTVYSFEFVDNGSKDSGILLGNSATLNASAGNYFAAGSIVLLFAGGQLFTRDASAKTPAATYAVGERVAVRIEADIDAKTYDLYVNGALAARGVGFRVPAGSINTLALVENAGGQAFDVFGFKCE
ncbi:MAG: hypothetical protein J1F63_02265 [Oscillospiraceae bacterium]|nr:hypothetical protein [Oscillospiraceae bacterium]